MSAPHANDQPTEQQPRRGSISRGLTDLFSSSRSTTAAAYPGPIASAANSRRRMSISSGITGTSPPRIQAQMPIRRGSIASVSSAASSVVDENAVEDDEGPTQPFARRLSFGARALRDIRIPGGRVPTGAASPTVARGFWGDSGRSNSISQGDEAGQQRRQSIATMPEPVNTMPKRSNTVDPMQERMLKGDFYFD